MLAYADTTQDIQGCLVHSDCTSTLAEAIESSEMPDEVFCYEGTTKHLTGVDEPCLKHPLTASGMRQVIMNLVKLHVAIRKVANRAVKAKVDLPAIRIGREASGPYLTTHCLEVEHPCTGGC